MVPLLVWICAVIGGILLGQALQNAIAQEPFPTHGVWSCEDGIDNDGDTLIDFADPSCVLFGSEGGWNTSATPVPTAEPTPEPTTEPTLEPTTAPTATPSAVPPATPAELPSTGGRP
jgi:hypothetical protein